MARRERDRRRATLGRVAAGAALGYLVGTFPTADLVTRAVTAADGLEAFRAQALDHFAVIVTDITMETQTSGISMLREMHRAGYRGKSLFSRMADGTTSTLLYGYQRNPLAVDLTFGAGINNLLDKEPPYIFAIGTNTDTKLYSSAVTGRFVFLRLTSDF